ncbi:MAG: Hpt domain-containing protein [Turneriella sp.]
MKWEKDADAHHYVELLRAIHTIKGNAGIFELTHVIDICHALETRLEEIRTTGNNLEPAFIDVGLIALDRMQMLIHSMDDAAKQARVSGVYSARCKAGNTAAFSPRARLAGCKRERAPATAERRSGQPPCRITASNGLKTIEENPPAREIP